MGAMLDPWIGPIHFNMWLEVHVRILVGSVSGACKQYEQGRGDPRFNWETFPQLPWGMIENPKMIQTADGNCHLISGWWACLCKPARAAKIAELYKFILCIC
ncbi:uncharacterized protein BXZ73DRAFT_75434 [Epithele typhae]|uniref:uncharacterized protein n=1 Tax=Epithele typhae TaxID=378194 RepID=UPI002008C51E|nr:uncharacterized protein BXZ73DRAFT_75434 [Epithele typhae]KAH9940912.1 hypothetical protein BXZ73DRAFT_75434 [Epithele typhae]